MDQQRLGDLVLPPNTFAHVLDTTKGKVSSYVGPNKTSLSDNDQLVLWMHGEFLLADRNDAIQKFIRADEGQYVILSDPAQDDPNHFPPPQSSTEAIELAAGRKVVIPGPISFPLWPGQEAQVVDGHHLRNNQYLLVRVYEPEQARANAEAAVVARTDGEDQPAAKVSPDDYTMGKLMVIKGTDVSYYIPNTGIEVVPENDEYIRGAVTLQRLEYCILLDESGDKRFVKGPDVVFPKPTEIFQTDENGKRRFRAIELNPQSGLYIKVIADYKEGGEEHKVGQERFVIGNTEENAIYYPRPEESILTYGEQRKHHAIALPSGEGRYVLDRTSGDVGLIEGPRMFLPDPRTQVIIRRILDPDLCEVMFPGNEEALQANLSYAEEGVQLSNMMEEQRMRGVASAPSAASTYASVSSSPVPPAAMAAAATMDSLQYNEETTQRQVKARGASRTGADLHRGTKYTRPRTIVLDTKYEGAVKMNVWPGYAIMLVSSTGERRVIEGPQPVLLDYDETPMVLSLSSGKPKTDNNLIQTSYLRTINNQVSDRVQVETQDLVPMTIDLSYRVNFEGETEKWFNLDNYVKVLTDHFRSKLRNLAKRYRVEEFYTNNIDLIRDALLGEVVESARPGFKFEDNGMHLYDIEVLGVKINSGEIEGLMRGAMNNALQGAIRLSEAEIRTGQEAEHERLTREAIDEQEKTLNKRHTVAVEALTRDLEQRLQLVATELDIETHVKEVAALKRAENALDAESELEIERNQVQMSLEAAKEEVAQFADRMKAINPNLLQAMTAFGDQSFVERLVTAIGPAALAARVSPADLLHQVFEGTPLESITEHLKDRPYALTNGGREE